MAQMTREEAQKYLERKGKIQGRVYYTEKEDKEIKKAMTEGKIYGDPIAKIKFTK